MYPLCEISGFMNNAWDTRGWSLDIYFRSFKQPQWAWWQCLQFHNLLSPRSALAW